jgi:hypothetical protein
MKLKTENFKTTTDLGNGNVPVMRCPDLKWGYQLSQRVSAAFGDALDARNENDLECLHVMCCDNLELLKSQPNESVNMIYCDILYGIGRNFGDYQDLKPIRSEIERHYLPRLIEMKRVLK